jgi:hypothetical protein
MPVQPQIKNGWEDLKGSFPAIFSIPIKPLVTFVRNL